MPPAMPDAASRVVAPKLREGTDAVNSAIAASIAGMHPRSASSTGEVQNPTCREYEEAAAPEPVR